MASEFPTKSPSEKSFIFIFSLGQFFGVFPLEFLRNGVKFKWISFKTIYSLFHIFLEGSVVFSCVAYGCVNGWSFRNIIRTTFYASNFWSTLELFRLACRLPALMKKWYQLDVDLKHNYGYPKNLVKRSKLSSLMALFYAAFQVGIFFLYNYYTTKNTAKKLNIVHDLEFYCKLTFPQTFYFLPASRYLGLLSQLNYIFTYFRMVYIELFISLLSSFLSLRFQQITARLAEQLDKKRSLEFWREVREDYDKICNLCKFADETVTNTAFASLTGNLLLTLGYLRNATILEGLNLQKLYNVSNFIILLIRCVVMLIYVAWVNEESKEPVYVLNSVSSAQYNSEIQRFLLQISFDEVAFTGNKMFRMTRTLILNIGGVILTYELVLVQFADMEIFH